MFFFVFAFFFCLGEKYPGMISIVGCKLEELQSHDKVKVGFLQLISQVCWKFFYICPLEELFLGFESPPPQTAGILTQDQASTGTAQATGGVAQAVRGLAQAQGLSNPGEEKNTKICKEHKIGHCKNQANCQGSHPKKCPKITNFGLYKFDQRGCEPSTCPHGYHPRICYHSMVFKSCTKKGCKLYHLPEQMARPSKYQRTTSHIRVTRTPAGNKKCSAEKAQATSLIGFQGIKDFINLLSIQTGFQFTQDINNHHLHLKNQDRFLF